MLISLNKNTAKMMSDMQLRSQLNYMIIKSLIPNPILQLSNS